MERLPPEVKSKWIAALRSGEWRQGIGELRTETGFCCLGVLAEVLEPGVTEHSQQLGGLCMLREMAYEDFPYKSTFIERHGLQALLGESHALKQLADEYRSDEANNVADASIDTSLMCLNDDGEYSFEQLADLIEEYL